MGHAEPPTAPAPLQILLAVGDQPGRLSLMALQLPAGATAGDALRAAGLLARLGADTLDGLTLARWGRACGVDAPLHDGDRLALIRPLVVDPKESRRLRYRRDGIRPRRRQRPVPESLPKTPLP